MTLRITYGPRCVPVGSGMAERETVYFSRDRRPICFSATISALSRQSSFGQVVHLALRAFAPLAWKGVSMCSSHPLHDGVRVRLFVLCVVVSVGAACGGATESGDTSLVVEVSSSAVTVENRTGTSLTKGEVSLIPQGIPRPYVVFLPYMSSGAKRTFALSAFKASDGTPFRQDVAKGRSVKVTATDTAGKTYEREVPFK
jgi:hypothetical protein